jgi:hypothetical protein
MPNRMTKVFVPMVLAIAFAMASDSFAQNPPEGFFDSDRDSLPKGALALSFSHLSNPSLFLRFTVMAEPRLDRPNDLKLRLYFKSDPTVFHRIVVDELHHIYLGYDLTAELASEGQYRISLLPLSIGPQSFLPSGYKNTPSVVLLSKYPDAQLVRSGDTIALDLFASPDGKQKIVDYIRFSSQAPPPNVTDPLAAISTGEPKDFTLDDGPLKLYQEPTIWIDNQKYLGLRYGAGGSGATLWVYFSGEGRYVLSLVPHDGFVRSGTIRDNVISFQMDGHQYELRMASPPVGSGGVWNLYVLHDPSFQWKNPDPNERGLRVDVAAGTPVVILGIDRLENLLPKE